VVAVIVLLVVIIATSAAEPEALLVSLTGSRW
jgi:hypothetical protein